MKYLQKQLIQITNLFKRHIKIMSFCYLFILIAVLYIPFLNKPIHIDDTTFINMSRSIGPLVGDNSSVEGYFLGNKVKRVSPLYSIHPLIPYYLRFIRIAFPGDSEIIYHLFYLVFPLLLITGIYGICLQLDIPLFPTLLFTMGSAAYLPVSHTLMADAPTFSFLTLSFYFFIKGIKYDRGSSIVASILCVFLAISASYQSVFMLFIQYMYLIIYERDKKKWIAAYLFVFLILIGSFFYFYLLNAFPLSGIMNEVLMGMREDVLGGKMLSLLICVGTISLFINPLFLFDDLFQGFKKRSFFIVLCCIIVSSVMVGLMRYPLLESLWLIILVGSGIVFMFRISVEAAGIKDINRKKTITFLLLWFYAVIIYNAIFVPFSALRYMMPLLLPAVVISMLLLGNTRLRNLYAAAALTALIGIAVSFGDYIFASSYRKFSLEVCETVGRDNNRIWYVGDWGMQYYMRKKGYKYLTTSSNDPLKGDLIFLTDKQKIWGPSPDLYKRMELIDIVEYESKFPIRVMGVDMKTGYYSHLWGLQPFTLSTQPVERFGVFRVIK